MRILYGVQGTGNGHLSRSRLVLRELTVRGAEVDVLVSGRAADQVPAMPGARRVLHREGLTFAVKNGRVDSLKTALQASPHRAWRAMRSLNLERYDHVVTDYEPITAWAGRLQSRSVIGVGHQYAFGPGTPTAKGDPLARALLRHFAPASRALGLHWAPYGDGILPPIVDTARLLRRACHGKVVVYLPWENQAAVTAMLNGIPGWQFRVYGPVAAVQREGNVTRLPVSREGFHEDLCGAVAVICNAGFELTSEAIHLGVPVLVRPLAGQFEQQSNAVALQAARLATVMPELSRTFIQTWLEGSPPVVEIRYPDVAAAVAQWVVEGATACPSILASALWSGASLADSPASSPISCSQPASNAT